MDPDMIEVLENCDIFSGLDDKQIKKIANICHMETFETGENLLSQGDFGENLYIIAEGHVLLERSVDMGHRKANVAISMLGKRRALGCWSTLLGEGHNLNTSATCRKPTKAVVVKGQVLREIMIADVQLGFKTLERLCFILRDRIQGIYGAMENI